jgi:xanthine/uracil permease
VEPLDFREFRFTMEFQSGPGGPDGSRTGDTLVLGPLPRLHRLFLITTVLAVGIASGAWIALFTSLPVALTAGAAVGAVAGLLLGLLLVHDFSHQAPPARAVHRR